MLISMEIQESLKKSSWIRQMFEEGNRLKAEFGNEAVFDFSLGNPHLPPPQGFTDRLREIANGSQDSIHQYMPNAGWPEVREKIAHDLNRRDGLPWNGSDVIMTVGAGGALNIFLKAILNPGDEVVVLSPYFVEYLFYIKNHGGNLVDCPTREDFSPDPEALLACITEKTKAVIINSPNNPTGRVYTAEELSIFTDALEEASQKVGHPIFLVTDEPYKKVTYDGVICPEVQSHYSHTVVITSHSKDLGLAGDRIGYMAVSPNIEDRLELVAGATFANRTLGFVNAPSLLQLAVADCQELTVDCSEYQANRQLLMAQFDEIGLEYVRPDGAFFLFPKTPEADDVAFVKEAQKEKILVVPGSGFGRSGHFRLSYAVPEKQVRNSLPAWERLMDRVNSNSSN
ncbi:MAG: pyridoxal phosphate-dependent aminotransferase [Proteobacteria bacterium]|nr:pyridoxal phosphate-dependent aminotransferase [Pseudomonadota bacterium]